MLSQTLEYALRAVVYLADVAPETRSTAEVAEEMQIPPAYLFKILQSLNREKIVLTRRGNGGGVTLLRAPEDVTLLEVVQAVDPVRRIEKCPLKLKRHSARLCPLHRRLDDAFASLEEAFRQTTLADIITESTEGAICSDRVVT